MPRLRIGLTAKLLMVTVSLAAIPLVGVGYVREMEGLLREQQEQNLLAAARAVATALNDRPTIKRLLPRPPAPQPPQPTPTLRPPGTPAVARSRAAAGPTPTLVAT